MNRLLKIISITLLIVIAITLYRSKVSAVSEAKGYVTKKETAEMVGRAILMELFPGSVRSNTTLTVVDRGDKWYVNNMSEEKGVEQLGNGFPFEASLNLESEDKGVGSLGNRFPFEASLNLGSEDKGVRQLGNGFYVITMGGGVGVVIKKADCQIVEIVVVD